MNVCAAIHHSPNSGGMARHLAPFVRRQRIAVTVRRRCWGGVLPRGRHASISGCRTAHSASVRSLCDAQVGRDDAAGIAAFEAADFASSTWASKLSAPAGWAKLALIGSMMVVRAAVRAMAAMRWLAMAFSCAMMWMTTGLIIRWGAGAKPSHCCVAGT